MTDLPHLIAGELPTEEHIRVMEAYMRGEEWTVPPVAWAGRRLTVDDYNAAVDWWNERTICPGCDGKGPSCFRCFSDWAEVS